MAETDQRVIGGEEHTTESEETTTELPTRGVQEGLLPEQKTTRGRYQFRGPLYGWNLQRLMPYPFLDMPFPYPLFRHMDASVSLLSDRPHRYRITVLIPVQNRIQTVPVKPRYRLTHKMELSTPFKATTLAPAVTELEQDDNEVTTVVQEEQAV